MAPGEQSTGTSTNPPFFCTLGMIAGTVDTFSGKGSAKEYYKKLKERAALDDWSDTVLLKIIRYRLTGDALKYYESEPELANLTTDDLIKKLVEKFTATKIPGEALLKLSKCFQRHDESVSEYTVRLKSLGKEILDEDYQGAAEPMKVGLKQKNKDLILNQFRIGLKRSLLQQLAPVLMSTESLDMEKAEKLARQYELCDTMLNTRISSSPRLMTVNSRMYCNFCKMSNHDTRNCWKKPNTSYQQNSNFRSNFRSPQHNDSRGYRQNDRRRTFSTPERRSSYSNNFNSQQRSGSRPNNYNQGRQDTQERRTNYNPRYQTNHSYQKNQQFRKVNTVQEEHLNCKRPSTTTRDEGLETSH